VAPDVLPDYQELRSQANAVKRHALDNLDHYLETFERNVEAHGGKVVVLQGRHRVPISSSRSPGKERRLIVKSKSMTTESSTSTSGSSTTISKAVETDLGEYIIQLAHQRRTTSWRPPCT
jgi:L-lactate dehydrogenase complex protein LldF